MRVYADRSAFVVELRGYRSTLWEQVRRVGETRTQIERVACSGVTGYERTFVDVLDAPEYGGGWEETWRSLEGIEFVDLDFVVEYTLRIGFALTAARVGFFLEQHKDALPVEERHLDALRAHAPAQPLYFERRHRKGGKLLARWNRLVPEQLLARSWGEVA